MPTVLFGLRGCLTAHSMDNPGLHSSFAAPVLCARGQQPHPRPREKMSSSQRSEACIAYTRANRSKLSWRPSYVRGGTAIYCTVSTWRTCIFSAFNFPALSP